MGCSMSKDGAGGVMSGAAAAAAAGASGPDTGEFSGHEPLLDDTDRGHQKRYLTSLSPSVTLQALLQRPNLQDVKSVGNKVVQEVKTRVVKDSVHHLRNVFARPLDRGAFTDELPVYKKTEDEKEWLENALKSNFVFDNLPHAQVFLIVQALELIQVPEHTKLINAGEPGDYFYVLKSGEVEFTNPSRDEEHRVLGRARPGDSFGELALLYDAPRAATVTTLSDCELYRVGQVVFRRALQNVAIETTDEKIALLKTVPFLQGVHESDLRRLEEVMTPRPFTAGELLIEKGKTADSFWLIYKGKVKVWDIGSDGGSDPNMKTNSPTSTRKYQDTVAGPGTYMGEKGLVDNMPMLLNVTAVEDGIAFVIDKATFQAVLGDFAGLILKSLDRKKLAAIKLIQQTQLDRPTIRSLSNFIVEKQYKKGRIIMNEGQTVEAALHIIRKGRVRIWSRSKAQPEVVDDLGFFGEEQLLADVERGSNGPYDPTTTVAKYSVQALEDVTVGVLTLAVCRKCLDTTNFGRPHASILDSLVHRQIPMTELQKHRILGAGTFGQVWLVSRETSSGERKPYALKVQSKFELVEAGQARAVVDEKNIMAALHSPFLIDLVTTYKDEYFVYMLMALVQGGELHAIIHTSRRDGIPEVQAKFYMAGVTEGLSYMHRRGYVYRDLKPENVLIDSKGYPVIVDFGFAKLVPDKTYTLCGTPLFLAPEVILNRGHNQAADYWSLGVLLYEMILGYTPFYRSGMDQSDLFKAVVRGKYHVSSRLSPAAASLIQGLLTKDPALRLGSLAGGSDDILQHEFLKSIDQEKLRRKEIPAPFVPKIKNPLDASNFEDWSHLEDKTLKTFPALPKEKEAIFDKF